MKNKTKVKRNIIYFLCIFILPVYGQYQDDRLQLHAPNTYALAKYGQLPVDHSTGVPDIRIPLLSIADKDLELDVSLSYHAGGIKVDEEASWVGLGWALNAGGVITREVRDAPDKFDAYGRFNTRVTIDDYDYREELTTYLARTRYDIQCGLSDNYDMSPDIFYYNFCGHTGKFVLDNSAKAHFVKYEDFTVEFTRDNLFIITDTKGIRYEFNQTETARNAHTGIFYTDSWYLTRMTSPSGGEITFTYTQEGRVSKYFQTRLYSKYYMSVNDYNTGTHSLIPKTGRELSYHTADNTVYVLNKITASNGNHINFTRSTIKRKDAEETCYPLEQISLYDSGEMIKKKVKLGYGYFEANQRHRYKNISDQEVSSMLHLNFRLRLETLTEINTSNQPEATFKFDYFGDDDPITDDPYTLPYRLSPSQDYNGYYNQSYNEHIFPENTNKQIAHDNFIDAYTGGRGEYHRLASNRVEGGNREVHPEAIKAGTLLQITYPTGGYSKFEYESHGIDKSGMYSGGGIRIKQIEDNDGNGNTIVREYSYREYAGTNYEYYNQSYSPYHTLYYNPAGYDDPDMLQILRSMGIPGDLVGSSFILRIDANSPMTLSMGTTARYEHVTEKIRGGGRTEYRYSVIGNDIDSGRGIEINGTRIWDAFSGGYLQTVNMPPYNPPSYLSMNFGVFSFLSPDAIDNSWQGSVPISKQVYNENNQCIAEDIYTYDKECLFAFPNYKATQLTEYRYLYTRSYVTGGSTRLVREVNKQHFPGTGSVVIEKEYTYDSPYHKQVTEYKMKTSQGDTEITKYYYPTEYGNTFITLNNKNILKPIDIRTYRESRLISGMQTKYNANGQAETIYKFDPGTTDIPFNSQNPYTFTPYIWNTYDNRGLWQTHQVIDGTSIVYLWGYNGQYPIAEIQNATYTQIQNILGQTLIDNIANRVIPNQSDMAAINALRNNATLPANVMISTYEYEPLTGMKSSTAPNGLKTYYEYDDSGRLQTIYFINDNNEKEVLQVNMYNYKNK